MDLMLANMMNNIYPQIFTIIIPKVLTCVTRYTLKRWLWFIEIRVWHEDAKEKSLLKYLSYTKSWL